MNNLTAKISFQKQRQRCRFERSRAMLLRTCLICLVSIPTTTLPSVLIGQDEKSKSETGQDQQTPISLDDIFAGQMPQNIDDLRAMQEHTKELAKRVKSATVALRVGQAQGSGVIISRDGYVLTAAHVIGKPGAKVTFVFPNGNEAQGIALGLNHTLDSGLAKITDEGSWPYLEMGESESLNRGQWVMSVGHPGGFDKLRGPVVRIGRITSNTSSVLRSDSTLVGGDSGGPLFDMDGMVVGIHSKIGSAIEYNMHVPVDVFAAQWDDLENSKEIGRRRVNQQPTETFEPGFRTNYRLTITELKPNGEKAGLNVGDVIKELDGVKVENRLQLRPGLTRLKKNQEFELTIERDGKELKIKVKTE